MKNRGKAQPVAAGDGKHGQGRKGCVYRDAAHEHESGAAASADAGAAAGGNGPSKKDADKVTVCWIERLTDPELPRRMQERLSSIDIDGALSPAAIEEYVTGSRRTAFPLLEYTERTDISVRAWLDGQVGLLADGRRWGIWRRWGWGG